MLEPKTKHISVKEKYNTEFANVFAKEFGIKNTNALPRLGKVVVNIGTGAEMRQKEVAAKLLSEFSAMTGQKPKIQKARLSIAGFGLREGMPVGLTVTLRGERMFAFLDKLISVVLPRFRDFRGVPAKFDANGNYTLGIGEYTVFPEIDLAKVDKVRGLEITIVTNAGSPEKGKKMLTLLGMPFEK